VGGGAERNWLPTEMLFSVGLVNQRFRA